MLEAVAIDQLSAIMTEGVALHHSHDWQSRLLSACVALIQLIQVVPADSEGLFRVLTHSNLILFLVSCWPLLLAIDKGDRYHDSK